jgi:hypothetical protein
LWVRLNARRDETIGACFDSNVVTAIIMLC